MAAGGRHRLSPFLLERGEAPFIYLSWLALLPREASGLGGQGPLLGREFPFS